jgi:hypothetical protein
MKGLVAEEIKRLKSGRLQEDNLIVEEFSSNLRGFIYNK